MLIGCRRRDELNARSTGDTGIVDPVAGYFHWDKYDAINDKINVSNNIL